MHSSRTRAALALAGAAGLTLALTATVATADATPSTTAVVSEVYGAGGNSGATLTNDFVELQGIGTSGVDFAGYSVQYHSSSSASGWQVTPLTGTIPAGGNYLVQESAGGGGTQPLPTPDATGTIAMSGTAGTVALVDGTTALTCATSSTCAADSSVVDLVGYGSTALISETAPVTLPSSNSNTVSPQRAPAGTDTDDNSADFTDATPTPENTGDGGGGDPQPGPLAIHDIQGSGWLSPQAGDAVTNVPGIVTAVRTSSSKGFWFQDPNPDSDPTTSEGLFVYTGSTPTVSVGDSVLVSGTVSEFYGSGESPASTSNLSVTEIGGSPSVTVLSSGNTVPPAVVITSSTIPATYAPDLDGRNIEKTPVTPTRSALDYYESVEGMRVQVDNVRVVGPSNRYGEQYVTTKPNQDRTYRGGTELLGDNKTPSGRLEIATVDGSALGLKVGDVLQGDTTGPIDWSTFGGYALEAEQVGTVQHNALPPVTAKAGTGSQLSIATYNVENLSPTDPGSKFTALAEGVVNNLASPDIVALEEIQDNDGATDDGVVAANVTLNQLTSAISAAGGPDYQWREIDPVNDRDGGQPGGNIRVAFLYDPTRVTFVQRGDSSTDRSVVGTDVTTAAGHAALTLSPGRIAPKNSVWSTSRKPLAAQFRFNGHTVIVIANHFDSKLGDDNADGRYQYPVQSSRTQREGQARVVHNFVSKILSVQPSAQVVVVGDLNDYQFSSPLRILRTGQADGKGTPILTDLIRTLPVNQRYTYVYNGISQVLDHILVTPEVSGVAYQVVHVNSEYSPQVSDHDPQVLDFTP